MGRASAKGGIDRGESPVLHETKCRKIGDTVNSVYRQTLAGAWGKALKKPCFEGQGIVE